MSQQESKQVFVSSAQLKLTKPAIDCTKCDHFKVNLQRGRKSSKGLSLYWCDDPSAVTLRGRVLLRSVWYPDSFIAPKECMRRKPCDHPGCRDCTDQPCEKCNRVWSKEEPLCSC